MSMLIMQRPPEGLLPKPALALRRLQTDAWLDLSRIHRALLDRSEAMLAAEGLEGITPAQSAALMVLFQAKRPLSGKEVADELGVSPVTAGRFLRTLEEAGWVGRDRSADDARAVLVQPTERAYAALPRFIRVSNGLLDVAFAGFDARDMAELVGAIRRVQANLGEAGGGTPAVTENRK